MKILQTLSIFLTFALLYSCTIQGSFQGFFSYYKNVHSKNPTLLKRLDANLLCHAKYSDTCKVVITNGKNLKTCLSTNSKSIVYIWAANCKSSSCSSLDGLQNICTEKGMALYIVAEYYDDELMNKSYSLEHPIFGIDIKYYKTGLTEKYLSKFFYELVGNKSSNNANPIKTSYYTGNRIIYLENGQYIDSYRSIEDIKTN